MLLVGSHALAAEFPDLVRADEPGQVWIDADAPAATLPPGCRFETDDSGETCARISLGGRHFRLLRLPPQDPRRAFIAANAHNPPITVAEGWQLRVASPASIALIWRARLYLKHGWHRRIADYHRLRERIGDATGTAAERAAHERLRVAVLARVDGSRADWTMRVSNEEFFRDFKYRWLRVFEHDALHCATSYDGVPLYRQLKEDPDQAYVPRAAFERLPHDRRIRLVREECYALALERVLIPAWDLGLGCDPRRAFQHALRRICTTLARGWFRDFAIDEHPAISNYDRDFVAAWRAALADGRLQRQPLPISDAERREWLRDYWAQLTAEDAQAGLCGSNGD